MITPKIHVYVSKLCPFIQRSSRHDLVLTSGSSYLSACLYLQIPIRRKAVTRNFARIFSTAQSSKSEPLSSLLVSRRINSDLPPAEVHVFSKPITYKGEGKCTRLFLAIVESYVHCARKPRGEHSELTKEGGGITDKQINVGVWLEVEARRQEKKGSIFGRKTTTTRQRDRSHCPPCTRGIRRRGTRTVLAASAA